MTDIAAIVQVTITRDDQPISQQGFGTLLILACHHSFFQRTKSYNSLTELEIDFPSGTQVYNAALKAFSQEPRPIAIKIGRRVVDSTDIKIETVVANTDYTTTINNVPIIFNSGATPTDLTIAAGLVAAINLSGEPVTATDNTDGTYTLDADVSGTVYTLKVDVNQEIQPLVPTDSITDDIFAIFQADPDWYVVTELEYTEQEDLAAWIETFLHGRLYCVFSDDTDIIDKDLIADTTSIIAKLRAANYSRSFVIYSGSDTYVDCAWCGKQLPTDPGSTTWANKTLNGVTPDNLNNNQYVNSGSKNANVYTTFAGRGATRNGKVASGEYIDIMRGIDWMTARISARLVNLLFNNPKVPYTSAGIATIESEILAQIHDGITIGFIDGTRGSYYVTAPKIEDIPPVTRAERLLQYVEFQFVPAGAIHTIRVEGRITL